MSNCTISVKDRNTLAAPKYSCMQTANDDCKRDMSSAPVSSNDSLPEPPVLQHDIIHDFVQRLESSIVKQSEK